MKKDVLSIDLSKKTPQEIAEFLSALLYAKRILFHQHGLNIRLLPKTRKISLNKSTVEN
jgi:hypothetical protein